MNMSAGLQTLDGGNVVSAALDALRHECLNLLAGFFDHGVNGRAQSHPGSLAGAPLSERRYERFWRARRGVASALLYYAAKLTGNPETAKDVLQDAWIRASRDLRRLENAAAVRTWLYRIVHGVAVDWLRRDLAREAVEDELHEETSAPEANKLAAYSAEAVHTALDRLAPKHREVLTLFFLEEFSIAEISGIVSCSEGTVKSRLHYAKAALRDALLHNL